MSAELTAISHDIVSQRGVFRQKRNAPRFFDLCISMNF